MIELYTDRLYLRKVSADDSERIFTCWASDDEVTKYLTWPAHQELETTKQILDYWIKAYEKEPCYRYGIELKKSKELIGMIDVVGYMDGNPIIGYLLGRAYWNKGYMTESLAAVVGLLFSEGYTCILIEADERNIGSNAVIQKNGFSFTHKETRPCSAFKPGLVTVNWYRKQR